MNKEPKPNTNRTAIFLTVLVTAVFVASASFATAWFVIKNDEDKVENNTAVNQNQPTDPQTNEQWTTTSFNFPLEYTSTANDPDDSSKGFTLTSIETVAPISIEHPDDWTVEAELPKVGDKGTATGNNLMRVDITSPSGVELHFFDIDGIGYNCFDETLGVVESTYTKTDTIATATDWLSVDQFNISNPAANETSGIYVFNQTQIDDIYPLRNLNLNESYTDKRENSFCGLLDKVVSGSTISPPGTENGINTPAFTVSDFDKEPDLRKVLESISIETVRELQPQ